MLSIAPATPGSCKKSDGHLSRACGDIDVLIGGMILGMSGNSAGQVFCVARSFAEAIGGSCVELPVLWLSVWDADSWVMKSMAISLGCVNRDWDRLTK